jgi:hypothetical protein
LSSEQKPYGGAPRLGNGAPGEPASSPSSSGGVGSFAGAPTITGDRSLERGEHQVNRPGGGQVDPEVYGGGLAFIKHPDPSSPRGNSSGPGAGATSGAGVP